MARLTVEDCIVRVPNRFELVMVASHRARELAAGVQPLLEKENDKNPVIALREIAEGVVDLEELKAGLIHGMQRQVEVDEPEEDSTLTLPVIETDVSADDEAAEGDAEATPQDGADDAEMV